MLLRRIQPVVQEPGEEAQHGPRADAERPTGPKLAAGLDTLRADMQRKLAAEINLGSPEATAPEVERIVIAPRVERRRMDSLRAEAQRSTTTRIERRSFRPAFSPRLRMKPSRILLLLVALVAGGLAAFIATQHDQPAPRPVAHAAVEPVREPTTQILVAKQAIGIGQRLSPDTVEWKDWPQGAVRPEYVASNPDADPMKEMTGSLARFEIFPGEPIRKDKLALPGQGYLSAVLDSGMRGVSVSISAESASGGFIMPDDHVDVVATRTVDSRSVSETILHNVRVLAINKRLGETGTTGAPEQPNDPSANVFSDQAIATLALDSTQAEVITSAATTGKLSLVLLSLVDFSKVASGTQSTADAAIRLTSPFWATGTTAALQTPH